MREQHARNSGESRTNDEGENFIARRIDAVAFSILILVLLFRPAGLLGSTVQEKV